MRLVDPLGRLFCVLTKHAREPVVKNVVKNDRTRQGFHHILIIITNQSSIKSSIIINHLQLLVQVGLAVLSLQLDLLLDGARFPFQMLRVLAHLLERRDVVVALLLRQILVLADSLPVNA
jgi:hypothetical protein